jgi:hypothetical protein
MRNSYLENQTSYEKNIFIILMLLVMRRCFHKSKTGQSRFGFLVVVEQKVLHI